MKSINYQNCSCRIRLSRLTHICTRRVHHHRDKSVTWQLILHSFSYVHNTGALFLFFLYQWDTGDKVSWLTGVWPSWHHQHICHTRGCCRYVSTSQWQVIKSTFQSFGRYVMVTSVTLQRHVRHVRMMVVFKVVVRLWDVVSSCCPSESPALARAVPTKVVRVEKHHHDKHQDSQPRTHLQWQDSS